ncbi:flavin monoamine oxidase family protein [Novosphingobium sp. JCM 18896]|uniref:flavin monoamine oxidase family protein n=1 Tax=Novosphingobium sp. JCM 18896 TaxID=2989731 RepID=UPI002222EDB3|nr:NAD(P)/FAD-dependent oxidoreductase [Novosphingobium sp. JCM 18896]MCW1430307.1 FAD-dependent oxidoreductase [Novosphingobium sp. JCM 18896]
MRTDGLFWRALNAARAANLEDEGQAPAIAGSAGLTRRRMLGAMAASAALPMVGCAPLPTASSSSRVAIVGGGLAGLIALRDLRKAGVEATLYEARSRLGGRVSTYHGGPVPADDGGQFINGDHDDVLALAREHRLELIDRVPLAGRTLLVDSYCRVLTEEQLVEDLRPLATAIAADAAAIDADDGALAALDAISVSQYLDRHHNLVKPYVRALMEATMRTEFGQDPSQASAVQLIWNLPQVSGRQLRVIGSSDERFVLKGGSGTLIEALAPDLMAHVHTAHVLEAVRPSGAGARLRFANGKVVEAERVIVTVPAPLLRTIDFGGMLPPLWQSYAAEIDNGRNEKLNAAYHGKPWEGSMGRAGDVWPLAGGFAEGWDATTVAGDTGLMTFFMGGAQCAASTRYDAASLRRDFETVVASAVPGLTQAATTWQRRTNWTNDRFARGSYACFRPGQLTRYAGLFWLEEGGKAVQSPVVGPLIFAGEHLSDAWPGFMNGGAQTGRLAAQAVLGS